MSICRFLASYVSIFALLLISSLSAADSISLSPRSQSIAAGEITRVEVSYLGGTTANGVGLRLHYDSSALDFQEIVSVLGRDLIGAQKPVPDVKDYDGDSRTDRYILVAWADIDNDGWLSSDQESLLVVSFKSNGGSTRLTITISDGNAGLSAEGAVATISS